MSRTSDGRLVHRTCARVIFSRHCLIRQTESVLKAMLSWTIGKAADQSVPVKTRSDDSKFDSNDSIYFYEAEEDAELTDDSAVSDGVGPGTGDHAHAHAAGPVAADADIANTASDGASASTGSASGLVTYAQVTYGREADHLTSD